MQDITRYRVLNAVAIQNYGRSGSTFLQSLLDGHPNILSTPNFYSRAFYEVWDEKIAGVPDEEKQQAFIEAVPQWFDTAYVDHSAGLHRLGADQSEIAHVDSERFKKTLSDYFKHNEMNRRNLFMGAHLAYGLCLDRELSRDLWVLYPIHGRPVEVAQAFLEDFPGAKFIYTVREPVSNFASSLSHYRTSNTDYASHAVERTLRIQFCRCSNEGHSLYIDRPYLKRLARSDQVKAVRLEDIHARPTQVMRAAIGWLGLPWHDCLLESTFDGKTWWNRPESPKRSGFDGQILRRNVPSCLSSLDLFRLATIAQPKALAWGYRATGDRFLTRLASAILFALTIWIPWREEWRAGTSPYRVIRMLTLCRRFLPESLRQEIDDQLKREERRYAYLRFDNGVRGVRARRPDARKAGWVQCMIVLYPDANGDGYKGKVYEDFPVADDRKNRDYAVVRFADELPGRPDRRPPVTGLRVLIGLGRMTLRFRDYLAIRFWTARAYIQAKWEHGHEVDLLDIAEPADAIARTAASSTKVDRTSTESLSAA